MLRQHGYEETDSTGSSPHGATAVSISVIFVSLSNIASQVHKCTIEQVEIRPLSEINLAASHK